MIDLKNLSKFGIGSWGLGGYAELDPTNDDANQIKALEFQLNSGMNLVTVNFWNSDGKAVKLFHEAMINTGKKRNEIFLVQSIYDYKLPTFEDVKKEFQLCLNTFETDYIDSIEFNLAGIDKYGLDTVVEFIQSLLDSGKTRFVSVTNFNLEHLKKFHGIFGDKLFSHELHYSFDVRANEEFGIIDYAMENNIINIVFQPLRRNRTALRNWPLLVSLGEKYGKTQNQIILNWLVNRGLHPLIKSENIEHIKENLAALDFNLDEQDIEKLNEFTVPGYHTPEIDWFNKGTGGVFIATLPNVFDEMSQR